MIIIKDKYGQLCNRLWAYSPVLSKALETGEKVDVLNFYDYYKYFENLESFENISFRKKSSFLHTLYVKIPEKNMRFFKIFRKEFWNWSHSERIVFMSSWANKDICQDLKSQHLKKLFTPIRSSVEKVNKCIDKKRSNLDVLIGVHIRKGDYKTFRNGVFFYSDEIYASFMKQLLVQFPKDKQVGFLICSNSPVDEAKFKGLDVFQLNAPSLMEDLYGLSICDFIIGPPSTYSMWASFYGDKPLKFLMGRNEQLDLEAFSPIIAENSFANGNIMDINAV